MELKNIVSISGVSGLFQYVGQTKIGIIARQLGSDRNQHFPSRTNPSSALIGVTIYTTNNEYGTPLTEVIHTMLKADADGTLAIIEQGSDQPSLREYFLSILPTHDPERVSFRDIKKIIKWTTILRDQNLAYLFEPAVSNANETKDEGEETNNEENDTETTIETAE